MRRARSLLLGVGLSLCLLGGAVEAGAQPGATAAAGGGDVMTAEAKARFKEGLDFYKAHKNVEARAKYLQALALSQAAAIYLNLAVVEYDLMLYPDALRHAKAYVVHPKAEPAKVDKLKKEMIPDLESKTAHLAVEGQAGQAVFVDGEKIGVAPIPDQVHVTPGEHTVSCGAVTKTVTVKAGDTASVIVVVAVAPPPSASTAVAPPPSATPAASSAPPPSASSAAPVPSASATVEPPKEGSGATKWIGPAALGAVGIGGIVVGAVFSSQSSDAKNQQQSIYNGAGGHPCADRASATCSSFKSKGSDVSTDGTISYVGFIGGGALLAVGVGWGVWNLMRKDDAKPQSTFVPMLSPSTAGMTWQVTY